MAEKLTFNLVSPEKELFSGEVDQVIVPGTEGEFGVLPNHAPAMSTIYPGMLIIKDGSTERKIFVRGGFADVTPQGLTVLAEFAMPAEELKGDALVHQRKLAEQEKETAKTPEEISANQRMVEVLSGL